MLECTILLGRREYVHNLGNLLCLQFGYFHCALSLYLCAGAFNLDTDLWVAFLSNSTVCTMLILHEIMNCLLKAICSWVHACM